MTLSLTFDSYKNFVNSAFSEANYDRLLMDAGLIKQSRLTSKDLFLGSLLYLLAMDSEGGHSDYLEIAVFRHGSFHAALHQLNDIFHKIERTDAVDREDFLAISMSVLGYINVLPVHLAPGFILAAHAYLWLHNLYAKLLPDAKSEIPETMDFLYNAMLSISIAHELCDISKSEIHNAYGPEGLRSSNLFRTDNTKEMVGYVFRLFTEKNRSSYDLAHFEASARLSVRQFQS